MSHAIDIKKYYISNSHKILRFEVCIQLDRRRIQHFYIAEKGRPLPKFGEWDVNDPASAEGFTVIFNKARDEKKTGGKPDSPTKVDPVRKLSDEHIEPQGVD